MIVDMVEEASMPISQDALMATMNMMLKMMTQHEEQMFKHVEGNWNTSQPETSNQTIGEETIQKLAKFKKFAPQPFKEANTPNEAEEWLEELETVLEALKTDEKDKMVYTEFLLQGEARLWWKMEKDKKGATDHTWKEFQELFLQRYFSISIYEQKEREFLYLRQENQNVM